MLRFGQAGRLRSLSCLCNHVLSPASRRSRLPYRTLLHARLAFVLLLYSSAGPLNLLRDHAIRADLDAYLPIILPMRFNFALVCCVAIVLVSPLFASAAESHGDAQNLQVRDHRTYAGHEVMPIGRSRRQKMYLKQATRSEIVDRQRQRSRRPRVSAQPSASPRPTVKCELRDAVVSRAS